MPIGDNEAMATAIGGVFGIDGFDTWDPSFLATPIAGMVAVVIGPDYFDPRRERVARDPRRSHDHVDRSLDQIGSTVTPRW